MGENFLNNQVLAIARSALNGLTRTQNKKMQRKYGIDGEVTFVMHYSPVNVKDRRRKSLFEVVITYIENDRDPNGRSIQGTFTNNKLTGISLKTGAGVLTEDRIGVTQLSRILGHAFSDEIKGSVKCQK